jgi:hypothetical protein
MTGWTPLYQQIIGSSIWEAPDHVRIAWITLLAVCNKEGVASVTTSGLARLANISAAHAENAIAVLSGPDPDTLTQANEGRRIARCEDGWKLLNFQKYRDKAKKAALREYNAAKQAEYRSDKSTTKSSTRNNVKKKAATSEYLPASKETSDDNIRILRDGLCGLFDRDPKDPWSYAEEQAMLEVLKRGGCLGELGELRHFQIANGQYFPQSIHSLLEGWTRALDRARSFEREPANKPAATLADKNFTAMINDIKKG